MGRRRHVVRVRTRKIIGRLTYSPSKDKGKFTKKLRRELQLRGQDARAAPKLPVEDRELRFGSMNINGSDEETHIGIIDLLDKYKFDVIIVNADRK